MSILKICLNQIWPLPGNMKLWFCSGEKGGRARPAFSPDTLDLLNHALKTHLNLTLSMGNGTGVLKQDGYSGRICTGQEDGGTALF